MAYENSVPTFTAIQRVYKQKFNKKQKKDRKKCKKRVNDN